MTVSISEEWIASQPASVRADLTALDRRIRAVAPTLAVGTWSSGIAYGPFHYRYASGREGDSFLVSIAVRKAGLAIYVNAADADGYLAEQAAKRLGKVKVGKSCITFRKLADLELDVLEDVVRRAAELGGAGAAG